ncbi:DUF6537 domain-containing protein [Streptomyces nodosus]
MRRVERTLIDDYRCTTLSALATGEPRLELVAELAEPPGMVRGYERVKLDNVAAYQHRRAELLAKLQLPPQGVLSTAS